MWKKWVIDCIFKLLCLVPPSKAFSYCITFHSAVEVHWLSLIFPDVCEKRGRETLKKLKIAT